MQGGFEIIQKLLKLHIKARMPRCRMGQQICRFEDVFAELATSLRVVSRGRGFGNVALTTLVRSVSRVSGVAWAAFVLVDAVSACERIWRFILINLGCSTWQCVLLGIFRSWSWFRDRLGQRGGEGRGFLPFDLKKIDLVRFCFSRAASFESVRFGLFYFILTKKKK